MREFEIRINETYEKKVKIVASSEDEAVQEVMEMWDEGEIISVRDDLIYLDFTAIENNNEKEQ